VADVVEVKVAQEILQTMGFRTFVPLVAACPGCGRTTSTTFQELAGSIQSFIRDSMPEWKKRYRRRRFERRGDGLHRNGPGESKHADIGISLPGTGEAPAAPVFIDGKKAVTLRGPTVSQDFQKLVIDYIRPPLWRRWRGTNRGGVSGSLHTCPGCGAARNVVKRCAADPDPAFFHFFVTNRGPGSATHHHSASKTRVNALAVAALRPGHRRRGCG